jgi:DNA-binding CsgD family transcriptional regulator
MRIKYLEHHEPASEPVPTPDPTPALARIWPELAAGRARIIASGVTSEHYFLRLVPGCSGLGHKQRRDLQLLERLLLGDSQKSLALDTGYSPSTIATCLSSALEALGLTGRARHLSVLLPLLLHAYRGMTPGPGTRVEQLGEHENELLVVSERPELRLSRRLSKSEIDVVCLLVEGRSYADISARRATSTRTVANQIANVYKKLRISGRQQLLGLLATSSLASLDSSPGGQVAA